MMPVSQRFDSATLTPGPQTPIGLDYLPTAHTTVALWLSEGSTITASVEVTLDNVNDPDVTPRWFVLADGPTDAAGYARFWEPWQFIRLNIETLAGSAEFKIGQATTPRA